MEAIRHSALTIPYPWTSNGSGVVTVVTEIFPSHKLVRVQTVPGENGDLTTDLPTSYDMTITDEFSEDIAAGNLAGRSASASESYYASANVAIAGALQINATGAGASKKGLVVLYLEKRI